MTVFEANFDESGKLDDGKVVCVAGYLSTPEKWQRFSDVWIEKLGEYGLSEFHMTDYENKQGPFKGLAENDRVELIGELCSLIRDHTCLSIAGAILTKDYNDIFKEDLKQRIPYLQDPYYLCFIYCLDLLVKQFDTLCPDDATVALVLEQNKGMEGRARQYFDEYKHKHRGHGAEKFADLVFRPKTYVPLQAADVLAYESRKELINKVNDPARNVRKSLQALSNKDLVGGYMDTEHLRMWADRLSTE